MNGHNPTLMKIPRKQASPGFTLVEIAMVLLIISLLLGSLLVPLGGVFEQSKRQITTAQLEEINQALIGFAIVNGRLPCPGGGNSAGLEDPQGGGAYSNTDSSAVAHGFVPASTLALLGETDTDGLLLDSWANPIRYSVTQTNSDPATGPDFTTQGIMRQTGIANLKASIVVCTRASGDPGCPATATDNNALRGNQIPALVFLWAGIGAITAAQISLPMPGKDNRAAALPQPSPPHRGANTLCRETISLSANPTIKRKRVNTLTILLSGSRKIFYIRV